MVPTPLALPGATTATRLGGACPACNFCRKILLYQYSTSLKRKSRSGHALTGDRLYALQNNDCKRASVSHAQ